MLDAPHNPGRIFLPDHTFFELLPVLPGSFLMGSRNEDAYIDEKVVHRVEIGYSFHMAKFPVTQALWLSVTGKENRSYFKGLNRPVDSVSWYDAAVFCNRLSELCGMPPVYFSDKKYRKPYGKKGDEYFLRNESVVYINLQANGFRLPNEAEWEYAAWGGSGTGKILKPDANRHFNYSGVHTLDEAGWYAENSHRETKPVGLKLHNELGLHDMSGNVWEWCNDPWHNSYDGAPADGSPWNDPQGVYRVLRGGAWNYDPQGCRVSSRNYYRPAHRLSNVGFRLVLVSLPV